VSWTETRHANPEALAAALADDLEGIVRAALARRGGAMLALAGGRTPFPIYRRLAAAALDWSRVVLLATDERWVDHHHPACNGREMRAAFAAAQGVHILPLTPGSAEGRASAELAQATLASLPAPFDAVLLGMGGDGHFASLFPGSAELAAGLDPDSPDDALVIHPDPLPPEAPFPRISLSAARLLRSHRLLLAVTGEAKRAVLDRAQTRPDPSTLPISALLHHPATQVEIHWSPQ
jgi:6-phosphogluconolactonase